MPEKPSKELLAYAFVAQEYISTGSALDGVSRLLAHIVSEKAGSIFSSDAISKEVSRTLNLELAPLVVESLIPSLEKIGVLQQLRATTGEIRYECKKLDDAHYSLNEAEVSEILSRFRKFASNLLSEHGIHFNDTDLDNAFLSFLVTADFLSSWLQQDKSEFKGNVLSLKKEETISDDVRLKRSLDTVCALFVKDECIQDEKLFSKLVEISWGAVVVEVVTALQVGAVSGNAGLSELTVFVDTPILLDLLELGEEEQHKYAVDLFDLLTRSKATIATYSHVIEEMRTAVETTLARYTRGEPFSGPLAGRLRSDPGYELFARQSVAQFEQKLAAKAVQIVPDAEFESAEIIRYFPEDNVDSLRSRVGELHKNVERRDRDAKSIAYVIRMRRGLTASPVSASRYVFVTRNLALCSIATKYVFSTGLIVSGTAPPCVTDRQLAGILWFCSGAPPRDAVALTRQRIIANCASAVSPRLDLVSRMGQVLFEKKRSRLIEYEALMRDQRAMLCLTRETLNAPSLVDANVADELLEKMRMALGEEQRADFARQRSSLVESYRVERERLEREAHSLADRASEAERAAQSKSLDLAAVQTVVSEMRAEQTKTQVQMKGQIEGMRQEVTTLRQQNERARSVVVDTVKQGIISLARWLAIGVIALYGVVAWGVQQLTNVAYLGVFTVVAFSALGFWIAPRFVIHPLLGGLLRRATDKRLRAIKGVSGLELDRDEIVSEALRSLEIHSR